MARPAQTPSHFALHARVVDGVEPLAARRQPSRLWSHLIVFAACVLLVNGLFGPRGLMDTMRARRAMTAAARDLVQLRRDNAELRHRVRRLRSDPATIEAIARGDLGMVGHGEILVTIKTVR